MIGISDLGGTGGSTKAAPICCAAIHARIPERVTDTEGDMFAAISSKGHACCTTLRDVSTWSCAF